MPKTVDLSSAITAHDEALRAALVKPDRDVGVHEARRAIKALRALVRLLRPSDSSDSRADACVELDGELKALADRLAPARDLRVAAATALGFLDDIEDEQAREALAGLAKTWLGEAETREEALRRLGPDEANRAAATMERHLAAVGAQARAGAMARAMGQEMKRARRRLRAGLKGADAELLHDARREMVRLQIQLQALGPALGRRLRQLGKGCGRLRQILGDHHDLAELERRIEAAKLPPRIRSTLLQAVDGRARGLAELAAARAGAGLRPKPKALRRRVRKRLRRA